MEHQNNVVGGRLKSFENNWAQLTCDPYILEAVSGYKLEFDPEKFPPQREKPLYNYKRNSIETAKITTEILNLAQKNPVISTLCMVNLIFQEKKGRLLNFFFSIFIRETLASSIKLEGAKYSYEN